MIVPILGKLVDYAGNAILFMTISGFLNCISLFMLTFTLPALSFLLFGVSYAIRYLNVNNCLR